MRVDQAWEDRGVGKINGLGCGAELRVRSRPHTHDLVAFNDNRLPAKHVAGLDVENMSSPYYHAARPWSGC